MDKYIELTNILNQNQVAFREHGKELITHCLFNDCDSDSKGSEAHLYIDKHEGTYFCQKCGAKGNLTTLRKHFGISDTKPKAPRRGANPLNAPAAKYHADLTDQLREYLRNDRLLTDETIDHFQLGYMVNKGQHWITIPVKDTFGNVQFMKMRQDPFNAKLDQLRYTGTGGASSIFNVGILASKPDSLVICEGEFDCMALHSAGIPVIASTAGAKTFKDEWIDKLDFVREFYVIMDNDQTGRDSADALIEKLSRAHPKSSVMKVTLPEEVGDHGDVTDYLKKQIGTVDDITQSSGKYVALSAGLPPINIDDFNEMSLDELDDILSLTIKNDHHNKLITFLCMLSTYTKNSQINVSFNAPSSSGKTYITSQIAKLFPASDKIERSSASPTSFYYSEGVIDKERGVKIISFKRKILIFYEMPNPLLQERLRAVLSHDDEELVYSFTNKDKKGANKAETIIFQGWPSSVFCSSALQLDEQETTRAILLSPETTDEKLRFGVALQAVRGADEGKFDMVLESNKDRINLKNRILAIKREEVQDIKIKDFNVVLDRFMQTFGAIKPRHQRDIKHLMSLIKAIALMNVWFRREADGTIIASQSDIDQGFKLWESVYRSQELSVPPSVLEFFDNMILPAYKHKQLNPIFDSNMKAGLIGVSIQELSVFHLKQTNTTLNIDNLRKQILPQLENAGLITFEQPEIGDRRSRHIFPKLYPDGDGGYSVDNNIGQGGGNKLTDEERSEMLKNW